jgi:hypothetical protein
VNGGTRSVLNPVFIQGSISELIALPAAAAVAGLAPENCGAKPTGASGGVGAYPTIPPPTVTAKAANAASIAGAQFGVANALARAPCSVETAPETVVEAGTIPAAQLCTADTHCSAQPAADGGGFEKHDDSPLESEPAFRGMS